MKKFMYFFTLSVLLSVFLFQDLKAQISKGGTPSSFTFPTITGTFDVQNIPAIDVNAALLEDANRPGLWAGRSIPVNYDMTNSGTWTDLPDGRKIWRLKLTSSGAKGLAVCYNNFYIPEGGKLFLYNELKTQIIGAFTSENNPANGIMSTELIQGETVTLEYVAPPVKKVKTINNQINGTINGNRISTNNTILPREELPKISISELVYLYLETPILAKYDPSKITGWGTSNACQVNVNCSEGANWQSQKNGVAEIYVKVGTSWGWCSGTLINTTNNSGTPYFLTAGHCYSEGGATASAADMLLWQFYFKYESATCPNPGSEPAYSTITGCVLKATSPINGGSDFCLILINGGTAIPQLYNPYYNGWDRTNTAATSGVSIHHPMGDIKKISTFTATLGTDTWFDGTNTGATNAHWTGSWVSTTNGWGQTEGGSSGSPIFNSVKRVTGTLTGGTADNCTTGSSFDCGKFYYHWDLTAGGSTTQLKTWLDPVPNLLTTVDGFDPYNGWPDFYGVPTTVYEGETVNFTDITVSATSWSWQFEGGTPSTSTVQNPANIYYNQQGTYRVKLTTVTAVAGTQTMEKIGYITVNPGAPMAQIWCDNFTTPANWTTSTSGGYTDAWAITTAAPTGGYSATNPGKIVSTSGGNYALFDSDALGAAGDNQWAHVTTANGVNCAIYEAVTLKFQEAYTKFYDSTLVYISTDNFATSTRYVLHEGYANNDGTANPNNYSLNISTAAAGKTNVKVRFTFRSTQDMSTSAGWGYAWCIDDVCMEGVLPGQSLPQPDFTASTSRKISPGQSVSYTDQSLYTTSWLWTFEGGTPATSTAQNPTGIVYNTQGYYAVTLQATNANGYVSKTKTDYIHVFFDCSYDSNVQDGDGISYYYVPGAPTGYTPGHNSELITAYADKFTIGNLTGKVKSLMVAVGLADIVGAATNVTFTIWDNNAGVPGAVLGTRAIGVKDLLAGYLNSVDFA
ncbi:MAG: PKD domain-containing protein, partial [Bacteroidales bacterium]